MSRDPFVIATTSRSDKRRAKSFLGHSHSKHVLEFRFYLIIVLCLFLASLAYLWDGARQKRINACIEQLDQQQFAVMAFYEESFQSNSVFHTRAFCEGF